jgi:uncharacterized protein (TIGR02466 family)
VDVTSLAPSFPIFLGEGGANFFGANGFAAIAGARHTTRMEIKTLFVTKLYRAALADFDNAALLKSCRSIAASDKAGQRWSREHNYPGYTSYSSLNDLPKRDPNFAELKQALDKHAMAFARELHLDISGRRLRLDSMWVNVLEPGGVHTSHIHPQSVLSGTYYVEVPPGASALKLEDPRHASMMSAPPRAEDAPEQERTFIYVKPEVGETLMWESFIRHEVPINTAKKPRISVSFNYA